MRLKLLLLIIEALTNRDRVAEELEVQVTKSSIAKKTGKYTRRSAHHSLAPYQKPERTGVAGNTKSTVGVRNHLVYFLGEKKRPMSPTGQTKDRLVF